MKGDDIRRFKLISFANRNLIYIHYFQYGAMQTAECCRIPNLTLMSNNDVKHKVFCVVWNTSKSKEYYLFI